MKDKPKNTGGGLGPYLHQLRAILLHRYYFFRAGSFLGLPLWLLLAHDLSKFVPVEFVNYSRWKYGAQDKAGWARGWLHHLHVNKHHPEYWVVSWSGDPDFYSGIGERVADCINVLPMPEMYVKEMIADWMATSKERTGSYDIAGWVNENGPKRFFHDDTVTEIHRIMETSGRWFCTDNCPFSFMASNELREWDGQEKV
jgi:hypothetical protein